ncbi:MAG: tetratricopeptide repeat protein [Hyphomicrobiales bacterium]|nr:tetratricopeptide repeat protein [Hyphomicrobiales bacterium]
MSKIQREELFRAAVEAQRNGDLLAAGSLYSRFVKVNPGVPEAWEQLGAILAELGNFAEAEHCLCGILQYMKGYSALHRVHGHLCWVYALQGRSEALVHGREAVRLNPRFEGGWLNLANALSLAGEPDEAIAAFREAEALGSERHHGGLYNVKRSLCDWEGTEELERILFDPARKPLAHDSDLIVMAASPQAQRSFAEACAGKFPARYLHPIGAERRVEGRRIRLAYLGGEFHDTAIMSLLASTIENHDRERFDVHAFSYGPAIDGPMRRRLELAFDEFHETSAAANEAIARKIAALDIDILLDLNGYIKGNRVGIVARRPAPIQISYLGWPATTGAPFMDAIIADPIVAPDPRWFSEKLIHLDCYMPTDERKRAPQPRSRAEFGLPEDAVVLASMNNNWKLDAEMMALWCDILRELPEAVLWQAVRTAGAGRNLRKYAHQRGVEDRFIISPPVPYAEHIDRASLADIALDTYPYGGHTTTCDMLWAGVPVVTRRGETFASRVATSLLDAVGLPELSTTGVAEYKARVVALSRDRPRLDAMKEKLKSARHGSKLFDNKRYTKALETRLIELVS